MKSNEMPLTKGQEWYRNVYLFSDHWRNLRAEKLAINPKCEKCGRDHSIQVHHLMYRNIYDVTTNDLQTVCRKCHAELHEGLPTRKKKIKGRSSQAIALRVAKREAKKLKRQSSKAERGIRRLKDCQDLAIQPVAGMVILTREMINRCRTEHNSFSSATFRILCKAGGIARGPGWPNKLIGKRIYEKDFESALFMRLAVKQKTIVMRNDAPSCFSIQEPELLDENV